MNQYVDSMKEATLLLTLDANLRYWQIESSTRDRHKTAFTSHHGLHRFTGLLFGLKNDPATFQSAVVGILATVSWQFVLVCQDDIVVLQSSCKTTGTRFGAIATTVQSRGQPYLEQV